MPFELVHKTPPVERRRFQLADLKIQDARSEGGKGKTIAGHAAVYDVVGESFWFREVIRPGAFTNTLKSADCRCLFNHDANLILGRTKSKTLRLRDEAKGLFMECDMPPVTYAQDLILSMERGDVDQMSFAFRTLKDRWTYSDDDELPLRELLEVELFDVSPVTFPFYEQTDVGLRVLQEARSLCGLQPVSPARLDPARARRLRLAEASLTS